MIAIIPARGGSKRIPRKNVRIFYGRPMIAHAIETAKKAALFEEIVVSSDDATTLHIAEEYGAAGVRRPKLLADDQAGTMDVMEHVLREVSPRHQIACCIYPCTPLLTPADLKGGLDLLLQSAAINIGYTFSVGKEPALHDAGAFYWGYTAMFLKRACHLRHGRMYVLPPERDCDINTEDDWRRAEQLYAAARGEKP